MDKQMEYIYEAYEEAYESLGLWEKVECIALPYNWWNVQFLILEQLKKDYSYDI